MNLQLKRKSPDQVIEESVQSTMERALLEAYLQGKGYHLKELAHLPPDQVKALMTEASQYASLALAQIESKAHLRQKIHRPS